VNNSGIKPVGVSILVLPEQVAKETESGIVLYTDGEHERHELAQTDAIVIEISDMAWGDENKARCEVGDRVVMAKYAGMIRIGKDGKNYRLIRDVDVLAILEKDNNE